MGSLECKDFALSLKLDALGLLICELKITKQWFESGLYFIWFIIEEAYGEHWFGHL